jgi:hypothetical protein
MEPRQKLLDWRAKATVVAAKDDVCSRHSDIFLSNELYIATVIEGNVRWAVAAADEVGASAKTPPTDGAHSTCGPSSGGDAAIR